MLFLDVIADGSYLLPDFRAKLPLCLLQTRTPWQKRADGGALTPEIDHDSTSK